MWRRYYHVTLYSNVASIIENGLDPERARGAIKAVWLCDSKRLSWACAHVSLKQEVWIGTLWVCLVHVDPRELQSWRWRGIYLLRRPVAIYEIYPANEMLDRGPLRLVSGKGK